MEDYNVVYRKNFMSLKEGATYLRILEKYMTYEIDEKSAVMMRGKLTKIPRKQVAYGDEGICYRFAGIETEARNWNEKNRVNKILKRIRDKIEQVTGEKYNFVLINRYENGDQYIGYHKDDTRDLVEESSIVGVSLGACRKIYFKNVCTGEVRKVSLASGGLIEIKYPTNEYWNHSIPKQKTVKSVRISLTFRKMKV